MSVESVSQRRNICGFIVKVTRKGPMGIIASNVIAKEVKDFLDKFEKLLEDED